MRRSQAIKRAADSAYSAATVKRGLAACKALQRQSFSAPRRRRTAGGNFFVRRSSIVVWGAE